MIPHQKNRLVSRWFAGLAAGKFKKNFHRMSLTARSERPRFEPGVPAIVIANHPNWWDALMVSYLSHSVFRRDYIGLFDPEQLERYGIFKLLGGLALDLNGKPEGSAAYLAETVQFLRYAENELAGRERLFWIFAQGDLSSPERPIELKRGFASIAARLDRVQLLKLTWSYDFWSESKPEIVVDILPLETLSGLKGKPAMEAVTQRVEQELEASRIFVRDIVRERRTDRLQTLWENPAGANPVYDAYRRFKAFATGKKFSASHISR